MSTQSPILIGICGKAGAGKDTFARNLPGYHTAFAKPMKMALMDIFGFSVDQVFGVGKDKVDQRWGISPREAMTKFGTDVMQGWMGPDFWVRRMEQRLGWYNDDSVIITDVRFPLETEMIKRRGGYLVEVVRPNLDTSYRDHKTLNHISEQLKVEADFVVINDKDLEHLHSEAQRILKTIRESKRD